MKLHNLYEARLDITPFGEWVKAKIRQKLLKGDSRLKKLLNTSNFTIDHVRYAIKNGECLSHPDENEASLGPTYLEQTISNVIRDLAQSKVIPMGKLNDSRNYFGLSRLSVRKLNTEVDRKKSEKSGS